MPIDTRPFVRQHRALQARFRRVLDAAAAGRHAEAVEELHAAAADGCAHLEHEYLAATDVAHRVRDPAVAHMVKAFATRAEAVYAALVSLAGQFPTAAALAAEREAFIRDARGVEAAALALAADEEEDLFPALAAWEPHAVPPEVPCQGPAGGERSEE